MKVRFILLIGLFLASQGYAQKLGFTSFSPYGGSNKAENHTLYYNTGEMLVHRTDNGYVSVHNGLLSNLTLGTNPLSFIQVKFYYDENENGNRELDEQYIRIGAVTVNDDNIYSNLNEEGIILIAEAGDYKLNFNDLGLAGWELTSQDEYNVTLTEDRGFVEVEYGLSPTEELVTASPSMALGIFRCGFPASYNVIATNETVVASSNTIWLEYDDRITDIQFLVEPDHVIGSNVVGWDFELEAQAQFKIPFEITVPLISDETPIGDIFKWRTWIMTGAEVEEVCYEQELRCSYDPNDKLVNPNRPDSLGLLNDIIEYTIRFQNTGNDYALNVNVRDTLSQDLDMRTFKIIDTSHPDLLVVEIDAQDRHIINFRFDNIYLPDSTTNEPGSNGYITYKIRPLPGLDIDTEINNTGHIYFDFNPAIVTNTTSTTLVDMFPIVSNNFVLANNLEITIFPNPSTGEVFFSRNVEKILLYDLTGKQIRTFSQKNNIDITDFNAGTYFLHFIEGEKFNIQKVVITK